MRQCSVCVYAVHASLVPIVRRESSVRSKHLCVFVCVCVRFVGVCVCACVCVCMCVCVLFEQMLCQNAIDKQVNGISGWC